MFDVELLIFDVELLMFDDVELWMFDFEVEVPGMLKRFSPLMLK